MSATTRQHDSVHLELPVALHPTSGQRVHDGLGQQHHPSPSHAARRVESEVGAAELIQSIEATRLKLNRTLEQIRHHSREYRHWQAEVYRLYAELQVDAVGQRNWIADGHPDGM